ncbi:glycoside hydrolase family 9 protein [[Clostridium] polysaccharolyticum]|uniref:Endoglucanase n=1 Tax=[Clostridium] polysaccharolyticum TaxID=29364 RepID=A0A1I0E7Y5_9FIRM|nr:glycoside hydrolase family 9 protein [[Clostridium] polysaccharolyticum]SET41109.1 endo-1,3(4)-beta-glucanase [[Clostridium] polysaccharolyticum]
MRLTKKALSATLAVAMTAASLTTAAPTAVKAASNYNYGDALSKSLLFYELQESGKMEDDIRSNWKGDSCMNDGKDNNVDLTGGWYDAGDNLKLNFPMAYTGTMLAWSYLEDTDAYTKSGQDKYMLQQLKRLNEYLIKCHASKNEYYFQVGGDADHAFWGAAEVVEAKMTRPSYKVTLSKGGSCAVAEAAASLATASMVFEESDPSFAATCLKHAEELYDLADAMKSDSYYDTIAGAYYRSYSGYADEMSWAGAWLYKKTGEQKYLDKALDYVSGWEMEGQTNYWGYKWTQGWDNKSYGARILLAELTGEDRFKESAEQYLDYWTTGWGGARIKYTPKGLAWLDSWGSLRYACNTAFLATIWAESGLCSEDKVATYEDFAKSQADYCLGSTGRSFVCGFGVNPPKSPHHRTASGVCTDNLSADPEVNIHTLTGALVGGPDASDGYTDTRSDYCMNEVAVDYNSGFTGLMAKMYSKFGGTVDPNLNAVEEVGQEFDLKAAVNAQDSTNKINFVEIKATVYNKTCWPARVTDNLSYRFYMDLSDVIAQGYAPSDMTLATNYNQSGAKVTGPFPTSDENIYYVNIDLSGAKIFPGGQSQYRSELQFRIAAPCKWDFTKSPSFKGINKTQGGAGNSVTSIPVYEGSKLVFGEDPYAGGAVVVRPSVAPSVKPSVAPSVKPSVAPSVKPSVAPSVKPSVAPSVKPSVAPSKAPVVVPEGDVNVAITKTAASSNSIGGQWTVTSKSKVDLNDVEIRYYFNDNASDYSIFIDNVGLNLNVAPYYDSLTSKTNVEVVKDGADSYIKITFAGCENALISDGKLDMGIRVAKKDWSNFDQSDDYSYENGAVVFVGDKVVSGVLPQ